MSDSLAINLLTITVMMTIVASGICFFTRWLFIRSSLLDRPGTEAHKMQRTAVPYGGGSGIMLDHGSLVGRCGIWLANGPFCDDRHLAVDRPGRLTALYSRPIR